MVDVLSEQTTLSVVVFGGCAAVGSAGHAGLYGDVVLGHVPVDGAVQKCSVEYSARTQ